MDKYLLLTKHTVSGIDFYSMGMVDAKIPADAIINYDKEHVQEDKEAKPELVGIYELKDGENLLNEAKSNLADTNGDPVINTPYRAWDPKTKRYYSVRHLSYDRETGKVTEVWTSDIEGGYRIENAELDEQTGYYDDYLKLPLFVNDIVRINLNDHGTGYVLVGRIVKGIGGRYDIVLEHSAPIHQTSIWDLVYQLHGSLAKKLGTYRDQEKAHE